MARERTHDVLVIGAGNGGLSAAAHLRRRGCRDVGLIEPAERHVYKPLQNYVGTGLARDDELSRPQSTLIPDGVAWHRTAAVSIDPERRVVRCANGAELRGRDLVVAPGALVDWSLLSGAREALATGPAVTTFVDGELARTRDRIAALRAGRALFQLRAQPASGRETALKPLFIACDTWRRAGVLDDIEVILVHEGDRVHPVEAIDAEVRRHLDRYGVEVRPATHVVGLRERTVELAGPHCSSDEVVDLVHLHPPYSPPALIADSGLDAEGTGGFAAVDPETLQHPSHPRVWIVGDAGDLGDARTGGALRHQVKTAVENIRRQRAGLALERYDGYTVAPIATGRDRLSFGEYDRALRVRRSLPVPDEIRSSRAWYLLDRYALPQIYWHRILRGRL
ncbi:NAD(P)/FAD-dependent oxidoreductase [Agrococcus sp. HG114]|uniref:NAD(P)/FAD-dependent oxidoreductase n=1 Tax=Agrococcus sp. HG114 TaxID=2969757 RepID=UPI00215A3398|nr:FAD/NAD(P)-binding oxidoreductase [Agrococcus sp. HG114]MCR8671393.1 NAD(P)/FAD-dependent oxidoreductase [Agrococcus sp. HG114]